MTHISKTLETLQTNQAPAQQESQLSKNGETALLADAIKGVKLKDTPVLEFKKTLRMIMLKLGIRGQNLPDEEEKKVLIHHIYTHYGEHTTEEVKLAFEMGIEGKLNVDMRAFENFSCLYFSQVMNAYREWSRKEIKSVKDTFWNRVEEEESLPKKSLSDETMEEWMRDQRRQIEEGKLTIEFVPMMLYDYAVSRQLITPTNEEKKEYLVKAAQHLQVKLIEAAKHHGDKKTGMELSEFTEMMESGEFTGKWVDTLKTLAKKMILFHYLKGQP